MRGRRGEALRLEELDRRHEPGLVAMATELRETGDGSLGALLDDPEAFFRRVERFARGRRLPADRVPQTEFVLLRGARVLGVVRVRHRLVPALHRDGGHIGYEVRPSERGKGYGTALLALALEEARRMGLERVLLTAETTNTRSLRVIERNGGVPDGEAISPRTGRRMLRYWIAL